MDDLGDELQAFYEAAKTSYPAAERMATTAGTLHALVVWRAAKSQEAYSRSIETATERLATFTKWLVIATGVLAAATIALVVATVASG